MNKIPSNLRINKKEHFDLFLLKNTKKLRAKMRYYPSEFHLNSVNIKKTLLPIKGLNY